MARNGVLMEGGKFGSSEYSLLPVKDGAGLRRLGELLGKALDRRHRRNVFGITTDLALKAACAQYLGYYPREAPCKSEIKLILREMERMHGDWKKGFEMMEMAFGDMALPILGVQSYARRHGILPAERH
jgi:hypothetical protein